jgi:hypothetical protein
MPNTTVSIRERIKTAAGRWTWGPAIPLPHGKLKPAEAQRRGNFYLVFTERGKKSEPKVKGKTFEAAVLAGHAKQRHLEDAVDGFSRPDPLKQKQRKTIAEDIEQQLQKIPFRCHAHSRRCLPQHGSIGERVSLRFRNRCAGYCCSSLLGSLAALPLVHPTAGGDLVQPFQPFRSCSSTRPNHCGRDSYTWL